VEERWPVTTNSPLEKFTRCIPFVHFSCTPNRLKDSRFGLEECVLDIYCMALFTPGKTLAKEAFMEMGKARKARKQTQGLGYIGASQGTP
jgi:hypothetical protein